jgi:hypothetical protein
VEPVELTVSVGGGVMFGVPVSARTLPDGEDEGLSLGLVLGEAESLGDALGLSLGLALGEAESLGLGLSLGGMDSDWTGALSLGEGGSLGGTDSLALGDGLSLGGTDALSLGEGESLGGTDSLATGCDGEELGSWQADPPFEYEIRPVGVTTLG